MKFRTICILFLPLGIFLSFLASHFPVFVENIYSNKINKFIRQILSIISGILPFSLGEVIAISSLIAILYYLSYTVFKLFKSTYHRKKLLINFFLNCFAILGVIYIVFLFDWGFNYYRLPFSTIAKYDTRPASVKELGDLCEDLTNKANDLRNKVKENNKGIVYIPGGRKGILSHILLGYKSIASVYPELGGIYGRPKGIFLSKILSYEGISGIYFPFTGEPNLNIEIPDSMIPSTLCHEMAHQRGFAREDEANFISYLVCNKNPDVNFEYSGTLLALINSMDALSSYDYTRFTKLYTKYSKGVLRDIQFINDFWSKYEGPIQKISNNINNAYLKANMQKDGVYSYGRMVDLLISERRLKLKNTLCY